MDVARKKTVPWVAVAMALLLAACQGGSEEYVQFERAKNKWEQGSYQDAAGEFLVIVRDYPDTPLAEESLYWTAVLYHEYLNSFSQAEEYYNQLLVRYPQGAYRAHAMEGLASLYESQPASRHRAVLLYKKLTRDDDLENRRDYLLLKTGKLQLELGKPPQARLEFQTLLKDFPNSAYVPQTYYLIGYSFYLEGRVNPALVAFRQLNKEFPEDPLAPQAVFFEADILEDQGNLRGALQKFRSLEGHYHNSAILEKRIQALEKRMEKSVR
ncbi:MAG: tetratricopeptide repeat protein [Deltaproteobacteria bacterium]|nr:tetratricopeptide repeat protein [Deltaproteobacteria bacterium]